MKRNKSTPRLNISSFFKEKLEEIKSYAGIARRYNTSKKRLLSQSQEGINDLVGSQLSETADILKKIKKLKTVKCSLDVALIADRKKLAKLANEFLGVCFMVYKKYYLMLF